MWAERLRTILKARPISALFQPPRMTIRIKNILLKIKAQCANYLTQPYRSHYCRESIKLKTAHSEIAMTRPQQPKATVNCLLLRPNPLHDPKDLLPRLHPWLGLHGFPLASDLMHGKKALQFPQWPLASGLAMRHTQKKYVKSFRPPTASKTQWLCRWQR